MADEIPVEIPCGAFVLEGRAALPAGAAHGAVLCHPHPLYGGTMDDAVVTALARGLAARGVATLRFNFRGVGRSGGRHGGGPAETEDAVAALAWLADRAPGAWLTLAGYSFGAAVAARAVATGAAATRLVAVALPVTMLDTGILVGCRVPALFVQGDDDAFCPRARLEALVAACPTPTEVVWVAGADHFLAGRTALVVDAVAAFVTAA